VYENVSCCRLVEGKCGRDSEIRSTSEEREISASETGRCSTLHRFCSGNISDTFTRIWRDVSLRFHVDCNIDSRP
jgi:hypothetical protein